MSDLPEPLTPADCDLRGLPFMPLDVVRLTDSDLFALSTGDEFKAAVTLWCKAWLQVPAASLPDDDRILAHLSGAGTRWRKMKAMAMRGFVLCADGRWYHDVIAEKANEAWKHRQKQREKANRRWGNATVPEPGNADAHATASPAASPTAHATAYPAAMQGTGTVKKEEEASRAPAREPPLKLNTEPILLAMQAAAIPRPPSADDRRQFQAWLDAGATLDGDIIPTAKTIAARQAERGDSVGSLRYLDAAVRESRAETVRFFERGAEIRERYGSLPKPPASALGGIA